MGFAFEAYRRLKRRVKRLEKQMATKAEQNSLQNVEDKLTTALSGLEGRIRAEIIEIKAKNNQTDQVDLTPNIDRLLKIANEMSGFDPDAETANTTGTGSTTTTQPVNTSDVANTGTTLDQVKPAGDLTPSPLGGVQTPSIVPTPDSGVLTGDEANNVASGAAPFDRFPS